MVVSVCLVAFLIGQNVIDHKRNRKNYERALKMVPMLIHLPPMTDDIEMGGRDERDVINEQLSQAQVMYSILSSTLKKGLKNRIYGQRHLSFEVIANNGVINYYAVVDAIHNCYKKDPDGGYDRGFADGIEALTRVSSAKVASLANLFNIIFYQLDKEKEGTAEFNVDIDEIMARVNKLIEDNKEVYRQDYASFDHWYERCQKIAREKYGLELG